MTTKATLGISLATTIPAGFASTKRIRVGVFAPFFRPFAQFSTQNQPSVERHAASSGPDARPDTRAGDQPHPHGYEQRGPGSGAFTA